MLRVLFMESHPMLIHGLPNGFRDVGCTVQVSGHLTKDNIPLLLLQFQPDLVITMGWTNEASDENLFYLRKHVNEFGVPLVYWATEDPTHTHTFTLPLIQKLRPDFIFTICPGRVEYYNTLGLKAAHCDFGFHQSANHHTEPKAEYKCAVAVVANGYPNVLMKYPKHYRIHSLNTLITPLIKENIRVDFWGWGWDQADSVINCRIPKEWLHGYLPYTLSSKVYSSADIVLGIQNQTTQLSQRTYEILASRGFLITSDTPEIRRLFQPDKDLVVASSPGQTLELVKHYLENSEERLQISQQGQEAVTIHSYANRALHMLEILKQEKIL